MTKPHVLRASEQGVGEQEMSYACEHSSERQRLRRGVQGVEPRIAIYPSERQRRRLGVHECKPIDQATLAALDLQTVAMGLLSTSDLADTLGNSVALLDHLGRAFGRETSSTVLANVALGEETDKADRDGSKAPRQAPRAAVPEREAGMTRALSAGLLVALLSAMSAAADHCPPGQFYRVCDHDVDQ